MPRTTVRDYLHRTQAAGLAWPLHEHLDDQALEERLFVKREDRKRPSSGVFLGRIGCR